MCKVETLWNQKTVKEDFSVATSDNVSPLFIKCFEIYCADKMKISHSKISYMIGHGLEPYIL